MKTKSQKTKTRNEIRTRELLDSLKAQGITYQVTDPFDGMRVVFECVEAKKRKKWQEKFKYSTYEDYEENAYDEALLVLAYADYVSNKYAQDLEYVIEERAGIQNEIETEEPLSCDEKVRAIKSYFMLDKGFSQALREELIRHETK